MKFAEVEFTLADASRYENDDDADNDGSGGGDSTEPAGTTVSGQMRLNIRTVR